jgi:hypothetical protein
LAKVGVLVALNNSQRNSRFVDSRNQFVLLRLRSTCRKVGPHGNKVA